MNETDTGLAADVDAGEGTTLGLPEVPQPPRNEFDAFLANKAALVADAEANLAKLANKQKFDRGDILRALQKQFKIINALDSLGDAIVHDLMIANKRYTALESNLFQFSQQLTVVTSVLKDKGIVTDEEMLTIWNNKVKPEIEAKLAALKEQATEQSPPVNEAPVTTAQT